jgi:hypothetical protein
MPKHHLMVGTWTPPGAIFTFEFDDESLELKLVKRTEIPKEEPISWMTFSVNLNHLIYIHKRGSQLIVNSSMTRRTFTARR